MKPITVGKKLYKPEVLMRAFEYYATSRTLYKKLQKDYKLPSIKTLTNISSKVNNSSDGKFLSEVFESVPLKQRKCVIMADEIYVKQSLLYHGGTIFGKAENDPKSLATSMLGIMVKCLMGGPTFFFKMIPIKGLDAQFLFEQVQQAVSLIKDTGTKVVSIICDGNRTN